MLGYDVQEWNYSETKFPLNLNDDGKGLIEWVLNWIYIYIHNPSESCAIMACAKMLGYDVQEWNYSETKFPLNLNDDGKGLIEWVLNWIWVKLS